MINNALIWLHENALRMDHPVFLKAPPGTQAIYIWDNEYLKESQYSLKKLVFIYESLCEMPIKIISGNTIEILRTSPKKTIYIPEYKNSLIRNIVNNLSSHKEICLVTDELFVELDPEIEFTRFYQYWRNIEKKMFLKKS